MLLLLDNYDSFTYNVYQLLTKLGAEVEVVRNDAMTVDEIRAKKYKGIVISPGPGLPKDAGITEDIIRELGGEVPILGICLGHQAIGEAFGAKLTRLEEVYHGVATIGTQLGNDPIFAGLPAKITMGRYHSWVVDRADFPDALEITAISNEGHIMGLHHQKYHLHGIQFHPESVLTKDGRTILSNWLRL